jgi:branched-chain amino acid transport system substrate-binding protein
VLKPAGLENAVGILSTGYLKDQSDPSLKNDPAIVEWEAFMDKYYPDGNKLDGSTVFGYGAAKTMVQVLKQAGDDLSRENIMKEAANLKDFELGVLVDGIKINTSPTDFAPIEQLQMQKFDGVKWERFGPVMSGETS